MTPTQRVKQDQITHYQACIAETLKAMARWEQRIAAYESEIDRQDGQRIVQFLANELRGYRATLDTLHA